MGQWGRRQELAGYDWRNWGADRAGERRRQRSRPERESRERSALEFARSRRAVGRDRRPLPGGPERNAFRFGQDRGRTRESGARVIACPIRICVSPVGAALAGDVDSYILLLPADLARDALDGS